ncbi:hypothetical protein [Roseomonas sp. BN140053]|uniref:hypothetical protein n=1 Tax=Roseomonas sp. BN140053 TaxID=3391898 RepID=UPI0039EB98AD
MSETAIRAGAKIYYKDRRFLISSVQARSPWKTYRTNRIEKVSVRRDPFFITLALCILIWFFIVTFIKPGVFVNALILLALGAPAYLTYRIGILMVTTKALSEVAFIGDYAVIRKVRTAIEKALHDHDSGDSGLAAHDDASDDDDD